MVETLHAWAVAPAALGTCCVAADRGRLRAPELAASVLMTIGMLDAALLHLLPSVLWAAVFLAAAVGQAIWVRAGRGLRDDADDTAMSVHAGIGLVAMAALLLLMTATGPALTAGHHGAAAGPTAGIVIVIAVTYGASSVWLARRGAPLERLQYLSMGAATVLMGIAALA